MHFSRATRGTAILATLVAATLLLGACCGKPPVKKSESPIWSVEISPIEDTNPTKTQHTFIATVYDRDGRPVPNVQVHWILARTGDAVGDIVAYDDQDLGTGSAMALTRKTDNQFAVSYTNDKSQVLNRGNRWVADEAAWTDFEVGPGQTWCTITSVVEGDSHMIAYVPAIEDGLRHKVFAVKHWQRVPHLRVTKKCPERVMLGTEFDYQITVENDGEGATPGDVMVMDDLPAGIVVVDGTTFPVNLGVMDAHTRNEMSFRVRADSVGMKVNMVEARAGEFVARDDCTTEVYTFGIDLVKDCSGRYPLSEIVTFSFRVTNTESANLVDVVMTDPLPAGVEFVSANASRGRAYVGADGRTLTWDGFNLGPGDYADLTVQARATQIGMFTNQATILADVEGSDAKASDQDDCSFEVIGLPKLNIAKVCEPTQTGMGETVTFRITVWNSGGAAATGVTITDLLPQGFEAQGETSWYIDSLAPSDMNGGRTFTLSARVMQAGTFTNVATATAADVQEVRDSCNVTVVPPMLTIRKECRAHNPPLADDPTVLNRMERATHTITVQNGDVLAQDVVVVDTLPLDSSGRERIRYVSSNPAGTYNPGSHTITWNLGTMQPNQMVQIEVVFDGLVVGPAINTARVTARGFAGTEDDCRLYVLGSPSFQSSVVDVQSGDPDADNFVINDPFYYVALVQNEGDADLKIDMLFTLSGELALESTPVGFISSMTSTAEPSGSNVLAVQDLGGNRYKIASFNLGPRESKWLKIPARGIQVTATDAATIEIEINWQLWYEGRLFPKNGKLVNGETTVIDPE